MLLHRTSQKSADISMLFLEYKYGEAGNSFAGNVLKLTVIHILDV